MELDVFPICRDLLAPIEVENFIANHWTTSFAHMDGYAKKADMLFSWDELNNILASCNAGPSRLTLVREGRVVPASFFCNTNGKTGHATLRTRDLVFLLEQGATLLLNRIDELHQNLANVRIAFGRLFRRPAHVDLYAGFRPIPAFPLQWSDYELFVLQMAGCTSWRVFPPTHPYPLKDNCPTPISPTSSAVWDGTAEPGSMLYIPRGWWYGGEPLVGPELHANIVVRSLTGLDLIRWVTSQLGSSEEYRKDVPIFGSIKVLKEHICNLRRELDCMWEFDVINNFVENVTSVSHSDSFDIQLPTAVTKASSQQGPML